MKTIAEAFIVTWLILFYVVLYVPVTLVQCAVHAARVAWKVNDDLVEGK